MTDKNINLCDTEDEKQRYIFNMLPTYFITQMGANTDKVFKQLTTGLSNDSRKHPYQIAKALNDLVSISANTYINAQDINLQQGEVSEDSYQALLKLMGVTLDSKLYEHTEFIDRCTNQPMSQSAINQFKDYLYSEFGYQSIDLHTGMDAESFYIHLLLSFIAHIDVYFYHHECSSATHPISLGQLFQKKFDPNKWRYDSRSSQYLSLGKKGKQFTCTSRAFLHWMQTWLYFQEHKEMPESTRGIIKKFKWPDNDLDGNREYFIRRKSEGKTITLMELYWLLGIEDREDDEARIALQLRQNNLANYLKYNDVDSIKGFDHNFVGLIWLVYAFFQMLSQSSENSNAESCIFYSGYYDLWKSVSDKYEADVCDDIKSARVEWPDYLKKQATRIERMA